MDRKELTTLLRHPTIVLPHKHILLLSHMRGLTSLLSHIIGSHPRVSGYYEQHIGYYSWRSMVRARLLYHIDHPEERRTPLYFDKLLHNGQGLSGRILRDRRIRLIFMLRKPEDSIRSIAKLHGKRNRGHRYGNPEGAAQYYIDRLAMLQHFAEVAGMEQGSVYIDAEAITENTEEALNRLTTYLGLQPALSREYKVFKHTGTTGKGDMSKNLREGVVARKTADGEAPQIDIAPEILERAQEKYANARNVMLNVCKGVIAK